MNILSFNKFVEYGDELVLSLPNNKRIKIVDTGNGSFHIYDDTPMSHGYSVYTNSGTSVYFTPREDEEIRISRRHDTELQPKQ